MAHICPRQAAMELIRNPKMAPWTTDELISTAAHHGRCKSSIRSKYRFLNCSPPETSCQWLRHTAMDKNLPAQLHRPAVGFCFTIRTCSLSVVTLPASTTSKMQTSSETTPRTMSPALSASLMSDVPHVAKPWPNKPTRSIPTLGKRSVPKCGVRQWLPEERVACHRNNIAPQTAKIHMLV